MPDENQPSMDFMSLRELRVSQMLDQARSGVREIGQLLKVHQEAMVQSGFTEQQAWQMTLQMHQVYAQKIMG